MGIPHQAVAQGEQVGIGQPVLFGDAVRTFPLEEATQYGDHPAAGPLRGLELGGREDIEVRAAVVAKVLHDRPAGILVPVVTAAPTG